VRSQQHFGGFIQALQQLLEVLLLGEVADDHYADDRVAADEGG